MSELKSSSISKCSLDRTSSLREDTIPGTPRWALVFVTAAFRGRTRCKKRSMKRVAYNDQPIMDVRVASHECHVRYLSTSCLREGPQNVVAALLTHLQPAQHSSHCFLKTVNQSASSSPVSRRQLMAARSSGGKQLTLPAMLSFVDVKLTN
jgi:hypothetical protein